MLQGYKYSLYIFTVKTNGEAMEKHRPICELPFF